MAKLRLGHVISPTQVSVGTGGSPISPPWYSSAYTWGHPKIGTPKGFRGLSGNAQIALTAAYSAVTAGLLKKKG